MWMFSVSNASKMGDRWCKSGGMGSQDRGQRDLSRARDGAGVGGCWVGAVGGRQLMNEKLNYILALPTWGIKLCTLSHTQWFSLLCPWVGLLCGTKRSWDLIASSFFLSVSTLTLWSRLTVILPLQSLGPKFVWESLCKSILTGSKNPWEFSSWVSWAALKQTPNYCHRDKVMQPSLYLIFKVSTNGGNNTTAVAARRLLFGSPCFEFYANANIITAHSDDGHFFPVTILCVTV